MYGTVYAWSRICMELYTHGAVYTWSHICMEPYTHGAVYAWSHIRMEPYMHGAIYLWCQLTPLTSSLLPLLSEHPWTPGTSLEPQKAPSLLPLLPACCPCSLSIPGSLELSWGLRKPPAYFPCPQLAPLTPSLLPLLPEHPWVPWNLPEASGNPQLTPLAPLAP